MEAAREGHKVLPNKNGGWCGHDHLSPLKRNESSGSQRNFCFSEADIANDQSVHRLA